MPTHDSYPAVKRATDLVLAVTLTVLTAPLFLLAAAMVRLTSSGPVIYSQVRLGRHRRPFRIYKIRTMYDDCERLSGPKWCAADDPRITPVGWFLRRTHLDELPQLWNVITGDMSLVGPRPERPELVGPLEAALPHYAVRLDVLPGVTGLAQVNLPPDTDLDSVRRKLVYDRHYVENLGAWLDARLILGTALFMLGMPFSVSSRLLGLRLSAASEPAEVADGGCVPGAEIEIDLVPQAVPAWREG